MSAEESKLIKLSDYPHLREAANNRSRLPEEHKPRHTITVPNQLIRIRHNSDEPLPIADEESRDTIVKSNIFEQQERLFRSLAKPISEAFTSFLRMHAVQLSARHERLSVAQLNKNLRLTVDSMLASNQGLVEEKLREDRWTVANNQLANLALAEVSEVPDNVLPFRKFTPQVLAGSDDSDE